MRIRLFWQLLATFAFLIFFAVSATSALNGYSYRQLMIDNARRGAEQLQWTVGAQLGSYFQTHGRSWATVGTLLDEAVKSRIGLLGASPSYLLLDAQGNVVSQGGPRRLTPTDALPAAGTPIVVDGRQVGTFVLEIEPRDLMRGVISERMSSHSRDFPSIPPYGPGQNPLDPAHAPLETTGASPAIGGSLAAPLPPDPPLRPWEVDQRVGRSFGLIALSIGSLTLGLAVLFSRRISAPLARLTGAARQVAGGNLAVDVPRSSIQEVDALARAFKQMAQDLLHADQLRRDMTADIAHELRTPLSIIKGKLEGILDGVYPPTPQHVTPVLEEANLLERLIEDLRLLSLAEAGQLPLHRESISPSELLDQVRRSFARDATAQQVTLAVSAAPDLPPLDVDPQRMQQVLGNLVSNSLRHTPAGGRIELEAVRVDGHVRISVADSGAGIAPEELQHVFDRFWRGDKARSRHGGGAGLGLAIARQLVQAHGGQIAARSEVGKGTLIAVDLPRS